VSLLAELQRRKVFKVGAAYLVVAWLAVQAVSIAFPAFDAPPWALRVFILLSLLGFPLALVMAWIFDSTPEGVKFDPVVSGSKRVFAAAAVLILLALAWYFRGQPALRGDEPAHPPAIAQAAAPAAAPEISQKSIAVLPFVDMSQNKDQEYFSDGIAEELLNRLAKFPDLLVAARTSAFQFKGKTLDVAEIGRQLRVAHVLEGSVRKSGTRLRITAQLIDSKTGYHMWSETYDRDATDIFKVQDEISNAIANELEARLVDRPGAAAQARAANPAAYDDYLKGRSFIALRRVENLDKAIAAFDRAIALDPGYSPAHSGRAFAYLLRPMWNAPGSSAPALAAARASAEAALQLDPGNAEGYMVRGMAAFFSRNASAATADLDRALALAPGSVDVINLDGDFRLNLGDLGAAERDKRQAMALDPLAFVHPLNLADALAAQGRYAESADSAEQAVALGAREFGYGRLVLAYARLDRVEEAKAAMEKACAFDPASVPNCLLNRVQWLAASGQVPQAKALLDDLGKKIRNDQLPMGQYDAALIAAYYLEVSDIPKATQWQRTGLDEGSWFLTTPLTGAPGGAKLPEELSRDPDWLAVWADPRLKDVMAAYRRNLLAWRACARGGGGCR